MSVGTALGQQVAGGLLDFLEVKVLELGEQLDTVAAVKVLEEKALHAFLLETVAQVAQRSRELGGK